MPLPTDLSRRDLLSALTLLPAARLLAGQQTQGAAQTSPAAAPEGNQSKFSTDVNVVNLLVTVHNKQGKIVKDLTQNDFLLDEEGKPQTIKYFSREVNLPLYLGLMVDTSGSQRTVIDAERTASYKFVQQVLREDRDLAFVLHFDYEVELLQDFTSSRDKLESALNSLQISQRFQQRQGQGGGGNTGGGGGGYPGGGYPGGGGGGYPGGGYPGGGGGGYPGGGGQGQGGRGPRGTDLYDAILLASDDLMSKQKGRKALILLTDGVDTASKSTLFQAIEAAQKADTLVYSVLFEGSNNYPPMGGGPGMGGPRGGMGRLPMPGGGGGGGYENGNGKKILEQIARETGGRFFQVSRSHPIDKVYADIEEDLRSQYSIGYTPDPLPPAGTYRHIHLTTDSKQKKDKDLVVVTREGYYAR